jgi:hypothetical protein
VVQELRVYFSAFSGSLCLMLAFMFVKEMEIASNRSFLGDAHSLVELYHLRPSVLSPEPRLGAATASRLALRAPNEATPRGIKFDLRFLGSAL